MIHTDIIVAGIAMFGTSIGSLAGILVSNKLTNYRIEQLEKKQDKHNGVIERVIALESKVNTLVEMETHHV